MKGLLGSKTYKGDDEESKKSENLELEKESVKLFDSKSINNNMNNVGFGKSNAIVSTINVRLLIFFFINHLFETISYFIFFFFFPFNFLG